MDCKQNQHSTTASAGAIKKIEPTAINVMSGKSYEHEFDLEQQRMKVGVNCWGNCCVHCILYRKVSTWLHLV